VPGHEHTAGKRSERESQRERAQGASVESEDEEKGELDVPHAERRRPAQTDDKEKQDGREPSKQ
jgi:hypothetical protein